MQLALERTWAQLRQVEYQIGTRGEGTEYWVFNKATDGKWENMTVLTCQREGREYPKTYGHYHGTAVNERYKLVAGRGVLVLQKRVAGRDDEIAEVVLIRANPGDEVVITPEWGHAWVNIGDMPLVSLDDWRSGHTPGDYEVIGKMGGLAYYLLDKNGEVEVVQNQAYKKVPQPRWMNAMEYAAC